MEETNAIPHGCGQKETNKIYHLNLRLLSGQLYVKHFFAASIGVNSQTYVRLHSPHSTTSQLQRQDSANIAATAMPNS